MANWLHDPTQSFTTNAQAPSLETGVDPVIEHAAALVAIFTRFPGTAILYDTSEGRADPAIFDDAATAPPAI